MQKGSLLRFCPAQILITGRFCTERRRFTDPLIAIAGTNRQAMCDFSRMVAKTALTLALSLGRGN